MINLWTILFSPVSVEKRKEAVTDISKQSGHKKKIGI